MIMKDKQLFQLSFRFFKLFAEYESTLKECGFFRVSNGNIIVDWDDFANRVIGPNFLLDLGDKMQAAEYILDEPPMKQSVDRQNRIIWVEVSNRDRSVQSLFSHIRRMRNNLFHGAKFNGTWFKPERSHALLKRGLIILEHYSYWLEAENKELLKDYNQ